MRDYAKVLPRFWTGATGRALRQAGPQAVVVALYLLSSPHANMLGLYYQPLLYIAHETGLGLEGAEQGLAAAVQAGFCSFDAATDMVWVHEMAHHQVAAELKPGDNRCVAVQREFDALPANPFLQGFLKRYGAAFHMRAWRVGEGQGDAADALPQPGQAPLQAPAKGLAKPLVQPLPSQEQEQEQEHEQEHQQEQPQDPVPRRAAPAQPATPKHPPPGTRKRAPGFDAAGMLLPDWLDRSAWQRWCTDRLERRKPITAEAARLQLAKLRKYRDSGVAPEAVLAHAMEAGHQGFYLPMGNAAQRNAGSSSVAASTGGAPHVNRQEALEQRNRGIAEAWAREGGEVATP
jgi:hypothetical protein